MATVVKAYLGSTPLFDSTISATTSGYNRPGDWLVLTDMSSEEGFSGLHAVFDHSSNFVAFAVAGNYTVDWGDGNTENFSSGATAEHNYNFADLSSATLTSRGYRQAIIKITPQAGASITSINLTVKHSQSGLVTGYSTGWLDLDVNGPNLTSLTISAGGGLVVRHRYLEKANLRDIGSVTSLAYMFYDLGNFQSLEIGDTSGVTGTLKMFNQCPALSRVPVMDLSSCTSIQSMFEASGIQSLPSITFGSTNFTAAFRYAYSLNSIPAWDLSGVTTFNVTFANCYSLSRCQATGISKTISFANCSLGATELNEIYTNLDTVTGQTITVTGNYGVASDDPSIATAKGWTVTG